MKLQDGGGALLFTTDNEGDPLSPPEGEATQGEQPLDPPFFQSLLAQKISVKVRLKIFMQGLVDPNQLFKRDRDRDAKFSSRVRLFFFNRSLPEKIKSRSDSKILIKV